MSGKSFMYGQLGVTTVALMLAAAEGHAHGLNGTLGAKSTRSDLYRVTCFDDGNGAPGALSTTISERAPFVDGSHLSVQTVKSRKSTSCTDEVENDTEYCTDTRRNVSGGGNYYMLITKTGTGVQGYAVEFHCQGADPAVHVGTDVNILQNQ